MSRQAIPEEVKKQADEIVAGFNKRILKDSNRYYATRYKGGFLYLDRYDYGTMSQICRLRYTGKMNKEYKHASPQITQRRMMRFYAELPTTGASRKKRMLRLDNYANRQLHQTPSTRKRTPSWDEPMPGSGPCNGVKIPRL